MSIAPGRSSIFRPSVGWRTTRPRPGRGHCFITLLVDIDPGPRRIRNRWPRRRDDRNLSREPHRARRGPSAIAEVRTVMSPSDSTIRTTCLTDSGLSSKTPANPSQGCPCTPDSAGAAADHRCRARRQTSVERHRALGFSQKSRRLSQRGKLQPRASRHGKGWRLSINPQSSRARPLERAPPLTPTRRAACRSRPATA